MGALQHVVLSWPTPVPAFFSGAGDAASATPTSANPSKSWIQIARTGNFVSQRYGKFSIAMGDLTQMLTNFRTITPKSPTRLPIDYDHLSMDPQKPGDGIAAGWISDLQLRAEGNELWGLVEWTSDAARAIKNKLYQFVSPSFVKDYVYKDGNVIGTTLLAAAITNHPFLEGMAALTLSGGLRELATLIMAADSTAGGVAVEVGQKVTVKNEEVQKPEQTGVVFVVAQVVGEGANAFVSLQAPDGTIAEWFRADELAPAPAEGVEAMAPPPSPNALPEKQTATFAVPPVPGVGPEMPAAPGAPQLTAALPAVQAAPLNSPVQKIASQGSDPGAPAKEPSTPMHPIPSAAQVGMNARREKTMKTFELTDMKGNKVTVGEDALAALPEYDSLQQKVIELSGQVEIMASAAASAERRARMGELTKELDRLSGEGRITKPQRDWALKTFGGDLVNLGNFKEWAALQTQPIVKLNTEHGVGVADAPADSPEEKLMTLANKIAKEKRISLRDGLIEASRRDPASAEAYREQFAQ